MTQRRTFEWIGERLVEIETIEEVKHDVQMSYDGQYAGLGCIIALVVSAAGWATIIIIIRAIF